jgi:NMD protein affecting ribosome stability and mRNA decay
VTYITCGYCGRQTPEIAGMCAICGMVEEPPRTTKEYVNASTESKAPAASRRRR